ncbi:MAG: hypothetical protein IJ882_06630 [Paludibacteraceae bacterium]|nr:hypothetical protein [Paludibacteraceae bacterium]
MKVTYHFIKAGKCNVFYREAGSPNKPTILLLHGFPSASHMFRELMPLFGRIDPFMKIEETIIDAQRRNCFSRYAIMSDGHGMRMEAGRICVML